MIMLKKLKQLFCKHKRSSWYTKSYEHRFVSISGERRYLICDDCGKELSNFFAEYEGNGFK